MNNKTLKLTVYALFLAIMLVMGLVPGLGFIPTPVAGIAIIQVPVSWHLIFSVTRAACSLVWYSVLQALLTASFNPTSLQQS